MTRPLTPSRDLALSRLPQLTDVPLPTLPQADERVRADLLASVAAFWGTAWQDWSGSRPPVDWFQPWLPLVQQTPELLLIMACAPSGYMREFAVHRLAAQPSSLALGLLLVRGRDWVLPVREAARAALRSCLTPERAADWVQALPLLVLGDATRAPLTDLYPQVVALLHSPAAQEAVAAGWQDPQRAVRLSLLRLLGAPGLPDDVQQRLARDEDSGVRRQLVPLASPTTLRLLRRDPVASIRSAALRRSLPTLPPDVSTPELRAALLDTHGSVRLQAQFALQQAGQESRSFYLAHLDAELSLEQRLGVLGGLAEVGRLEDVPLLLPFLTNPSSRVRAEALRTLAVLNPRGAAPLLWSALLAGGREAQLAERSLVQQLRQRQLDVNEVQLTALWREARETKVRQVALRLTRFLSTLEAVALLLEWWREAPALRPEIQALLERRLERYRRSSFLRPTTALAKRIQVAAGEAQLPARLAEAVGQLIA